MGFPIRTKELRKQGSQTYEYVAGIIATTAHVDVDVYNQFPQARSFMPFDYMEVVNNSAYEIAVAVNQTQESIRVPAYMIKPFTRQPIRTFRLTNNGAGNTVAGDVIVKLKKLSADSKISILGNLQA